MSAVTPRLLGLDENQVLFWNFDGLDASKPPQEQAPALKVDLAQLNLAPGVLLDIGWYPVFDPQGEFVVVAVREGHWETPIARKTARDWDDLKKSIAATLTLAKVDVLNRRNR